MSTFALISDLHANQEALEAIFADIDSHSEVEAVYCLGDIVGYGPSPEQVLDLVIERCAWCLMGNHDYAMLNMPVGFNRIAAEAILCQRHDLEPGIFSGTLERHRWAWIKDLPMEKRIGEDLFVHASPRDKISEYILPRDPEHSPEKMESIFSQIDRRCYVGHTHLPGVFTEDMQFFAPEEINNEYRFRADEKLVINVSSAGQPRDRNPRACYAIVDEERVRWIRVAYDIDAVVEKVRANQCLDNMCGTRLLEGR